MSFILNQRNEIARRNFRDWHTRAYSPKLKPIADDIGINYSTFKNWIVANANTNIHNLKKIEEFLAIQMDKQDKIDKHKAYMEQYMRYKQKREQEKKEEQAKQLTLF
ncbi:hypothetical protein [Mammaliicoccus sciuri]|uniref:hypothetical protein n=1 Tax=Mammaliicoccus sciuri TaxID=1296 RepID=UPI001627DF85|nr:hypothetical protein [Mammaliicoccus sciuri]